MTEPISIEADALYDDRALRRALGLSAAALAAARRSGALRYTRQGRQRLYKGAWILAWIESSANPARREADGQGVVR